MLEEYNDLNDYSIVLMVKYLNTSFLFMGDAEVLAESFIESDMDADVLKVGHHGSNTSSSQEESLGRVNPQHAIISCGLNNSYRHPHFEVEERLEDMGIDVYRTDRNGTIIVVSDGETITIETEF